MIEELCLKLKGESVSHPVFSKSLFFPLPLQSPTFKSKKESDAFVGVLFTLVTGTVHPSSFSPGDHLLRTPFEGAFGF